MFHIRRIPYRWVSERQGVMIDLISLVSGSIRIMPCFLLLVRME